MGDNAGEGFAPIFNSEVAPNAPISSTNTNVVSIPVDIRYAKVWSVQIIISGGARVDYNVQATMVPSYPANYGVPIFGNPARDDSAGSAQWITLKNASMALNGSDIVTVSNLAFFQGRVVLIWTATNTGGTTAKVLAVTRVSGG